MYDALRLYAFLVAATIAAAMSPPTAAAQSVTEGTWDDGYALLSGYRWSGTRYGEQRTGQAVAIYVAEPFHTTQRVKANDAMADPDNTDRVYKLNLTRDFQTGVYDYNTMTSVFSRTSDLEPLKISFSSAEWCGHVYEEMIIDADRIEATYSSYFQGESGTRGLTRGGSTVEEDNLHILLRGLSGDYLEPGASRTVSLLPSAFQRRLTHTDIAWQDADIERSRDIESAEVPAGRFDTNVYTVRVSDGRTGRYHVEAAYPHQIVKWEWTGGRVTEVGELTGGARLEYWELNHEGDERWLEELGLR